MVKDINPALGNAKRLSSPTMEKNDAYDALMYTAYSIS